MKGSFKHFVNFLTWVLFFKCFSLIRKKACGVLHDVQRIAWHTGDQNKQNRNTSCMTQAVPSRNAQCINFDGIIKD